MAGSARQLEGFDFGKLGMSESLFAKDIFYHLIKTGLSDAHILKLAGYITDLTDLRELGVSILRLGLHQVDSAHTDSKTINEAACNILQKWKRKQRSPQEAFTVLCAQLRQVGWNQIASELNNVDQPAGLTPQSEIAIQRICHFQLAQKTVFSKFRVNII